MIFLLVSYLVVSWLGMTTWAVVEHARDKAHGVTWRVRCTNSNCCPFQYHDRTRRYIATCLFAPLFAPFCTIALPFRSLHRRVLQKELQKIERDKELASVEEDVKRLCAK